MYRNEDKAGIDHSPETTVRIQAASVRSSAQETVSPLLLGIASKRGVPRVFNAYGSEPGVSVPAAMRVRPFVSTKGVRVAAGSRMRSNVVSSVVTTYE